MPPAAFNIQKIRKDFPILSREVNGYPLVYLDNAATTQKPLQVIEALRDYYLGDNSNVHRGVHFLSQNATDLFEAAREKVRQFINAPSSEQVIYTRGTTEGINLVASSFGRQFIREGDEIIISTLEHHSNIVPWQMICAEKKATLKVARITDDGVIDLERLTSLLNGRTRLVAVSHVSNALGTINPVKEICLRAHEFDARVLIDGAQAIAHLPVDVQDLDCDFYVFSAHKMYGPTGIGVLYGKRDILQAMEPWQGGGEMISTVTFEKTSYNELPFKFEAGTPDISGAIVLGAAIDYIQQLGKENILKHEMQLRAYAHQKLHEIPGLKIYGDTEEKAPVFSFLPADNIHFYDAGVILDKLGIAIRTGHHCTQPLMDHFGIPGTCRASYALYNTNDDTDRLIEGIHRVRKMLG